MEQSINLFGKQFKNPLWAASGCMGFGREAARFQELSQWGALVSKGVTLKPRIGNPSPRICETASGLLNSVGLQNPGISQFLETELPFMQHQETSVVVNVAGNSPEDYASLCRQVQAYCEMTHSEIAAIELNLSCPNVAQGCMSIGQEPKMIEKVVAQARKATNLPLIAKLTPNVSHIDACAKASEYSGGDAVSLVNTFLGLAINLQSRRPILKNNTGGLSGPAIKPIALRMVHDVYQAVQIPIIGMGGILTGADALEFLLAGASCVQLGVANFTTLNPVPSILSEMERISQEQGCHSFSDWIGQLKYW